jgi:hypothetical protein
LGQEATEAAQALVADATPSAGPCAGRATPARVDPKPSSQKQPAKPVYRSAGDFAANDPAAFAELNNQWADEYAAWSETIACVACGEPCHDGCACPEPS